MGAFASGLQGIGNVGTDVANGKQINVQQKQQDVMNRLNAFAAQAKLQQLQQQLKNTPEAQIATVEKILGRPLTDSEKASMLGVAQAQPKQPKISYQTVLGPDGKPHRYQINEETNQRIDLGESYEKPEPAKEPKFTYQTVLGPDGKPHRYQIDEGTQKKTDLGVSYERPIREGGGDKPLSLAQKAAQFNQTLNVFKTQLSQANTALNQANSQKTSHPIYEKLGLTGTDTAAATEQRNRAAKAISYLLSQKEAVLSGKADAQDVSDKAQSIMDGDSGGNAPAPAAPGGFIKNKDGSYTEK